MVIFYDHFILVTDMQIPADQDLTQEEVEKMLQDEEESGEGMPRTASAGNITGIPASSGSSASNNTNQQRTINASTSTDERTRLMSASTVASGSGTGRLPRAYYNVRAARGEKNTVCPLLGSEVSMCENLGTFDNDSDDRVKLVNHRHCFGTARNTSFEIDNMTCNTCLGRGRHRVLRRETERADTG
jgi:hypothetical protein